MGGLFSPSKLHSQGREKPFSSGQRSCSCASDSLVDPFALEPRRSTNPLGQKHVSPPFQRIRENLIDPFPPSPRTASRPRSIASRPLGEDLIDPFSSSLRVSRPALIEERLTDPWQGGKAHSFHPTSELLDPWVS
ncbi:MAG: hypothetical protein NZM37_04725 [Sandaracinaceae bacterium]|nr:hypothetical protein [Sandaracinaceae bacterium]